MKKITPVVLLCAAMFTSPLLARTVMVSRQTDTSVTFTFGAPDSLDYALFVAHGATDGGEDKYDLV